MENPSIGLKESEILKETCKMLEKALRVSFFLLRQRAGEGECFGLG